MGGEPHVPMKLKSLLIAGCFLTTRGALCAVETSSATSTHIDGITAPVDWETPQWPRAWIADANRVRTPDGAVEGFLFYRGIGNFAVPLTASVGADDTLVLRNTGDAKIPFVWIYDNREKVGGRYAWSGPLAAGLSEDETRAMLATWKESYFDAPGLRVFWIVPRAFTDRILSLTITPKPDKLERVLVGRSEVLTPAFEQELVDGFRKDDGARWTNDRYFLAYRERARQLGVVLSDGAP